jgi:CRP/FNR family transcriptional regulator, cyclic AMP receptor protein
MSMQQANGQAHIGRAPDAMKQLMRDIAIAELGIGSLTRQTYPAGTLMMSPDAEVRSVCFIVSGRVRLYRLSPTGEQIFYDELGVGDCLSELAFIGDHKPAFAQAVADTTVELLPKSDFSRLIERCAAFTKALVTNMSKRMVHLDQRLYEATALPMRVRLHAELLRLARRRGDGALNITPAPTHQELAFRIGSQREAVSKELARLSRDGVLKCSRSSIVVVQEQPIRDEIADWMDGAAEFSA